MATRRVGEDFHGFVPNASGFQSLACRTSDSLPQGVLLLFLMSSFSP